MLELRLINDGFKMRKPGVKNANFGTIFYPRGPRGVAIYPLKAKIMPYKKIKSDQSREPNLAQNLVPTDIRM